MLRFLARWRCGRLSWAEARLAGGCSAGRAQRRQADLVERKGVMPTRWTDDDGRTVLALWSASGVSNLPPRGLSLEPHTSRLRSGLLCEVAQRADFLMLSTLQSVCLVFSAFSTSPLRTLNYPSPPPHGAIGVHRYIRCVRARRLPLVLTTAFGSRPRAVATSLPFETTLDKNSNTAMKSTALNAHR